MKLVIEYDIITGGGTPDPLMAKRLVDFVQAYLNDNTVIQDAVREVERLTDSSIPLGRRTISVERRSPVIYGVTE